MGWLLGTVKGALSGIWGYVAAAGAALVAILIAMRSAKKAGQNEVIAESAKKEIEDVKTAHKVEREIGTAKSDDVRKRLDKYRRD